MTDTELQEHLDAGLAAVREAGPIALEYFRKPMAIENKLEGVYYDPVTEADKGIETLIRARLAERFPEHRIIGEEHGDTGGGDTYWIIDPIDGTRAFISGMPAWGILLGLVVDGKPVAGIMHQPFTDETFVGGPDGAHLIHKGQRTEIRARVFTDLADTVLYSTHPDIVNAAGLGAKYDTLKNRCRLQRWGGDCYAYCLLAMGQVDLVVEGLLMPYDIVPLIPIIERAGGVVTTLEGKSPMQGGSVVAAANADIHRQAMDILNG